MARISDSDPEMLRYFVSVGINLDSRLRVVTRREFAGMVSVAIESGDGAQATSSWAALLHERSGWSLSRGRKRDARRVLSRPVAPLAMWVTWTSLLPA